MSEIKKETLEKVDELVDLCNKVNFIHPRERVAYYNGLKNGANWQAERMYSEEEVLKILLKHQSDYRSTVRNTSPLNWSFDIKKWFEQFKKK